MPNVKRGSATFDYSPCGHLVGCDDPDFDISEEQARRRRHAFERDMNRAIEYGEYPGRRSSDPNSGQFESVINDVADAARMRYRQELIGAIWQAETAFQSCESWYREVESQH